MKLEKFKMTRKRIIAGVITVGLITGTGVTFAATDFGAKLQSWYDAAFNQAGADIQRDSIKYFHDKVNEVTPEYNKKVTGMRDSINEKGSVIAEGTKGAITGKKQEYIDQVNNKKDQLMNNLSAQFDEIFNLAKKALENEANYQYGEAEKHLTSIAGEEGTKVLGEIEQQINSHKDAAVDELSQAIENAKNELQAQLNSERDATQAEIEAAIDAKAEEVLGMVQSKINSLVAEQEAIIQSKADELKTKAEQELENVADGI